METTISLGFVIGLIVFGIWSLFTLIATMYGFASGEVGIGWGGLGLFLLGLVFGAIGFWPYDMRYHRYEHVSGTIEAIEKRILPSGAGDSIEEKYAVKFKGQDTLYGCLDTRCSVKKVGDQLDLNCIRVWEWASNHGYDCKFLR